MLRALYAIVRLSHGWISQIRLKLGSCNFHRKRGRRDYSFLVVNFTAKFKRERRERGRRMRGVLKIRNFQPISCRISETVHDMTMVTMKATGIVAR